MIIKDGNVKLNLFVNNKKYLNISLEKLENILLPYKSRLSQGLKPKEIVNIGNAYVCFSEDVNQNKFFCKVYKTLFGKDTWILLLMDDKEGYALYENPVTNKMELAWYRHDLLEPITEENEIKIITCYVPKKLD